MSKTWAEEKIEMANNFKDMYDKGDLSKSELTELLEDLIRTDEVMKEANMMKMKAAVQQVVTGILKVI
jgi:polyhydroxyalkanoate synthesis regulator phasin